MSGIPHRSETAISQINISRRELLEIAICGPPMLRWDGSDDGEQLASLAWNRGAGRERLEARKLNGKLILTYTHQLGGNRPVVENVNAYRFCSLWIHGCGKPCPVVEIKEAARDEIAHLKTPAKMGKKAVESTKRFLLSAAWLQLSS